MNQNKSNTFLREFVSQAMRDYFEKIDDFYKKFYEILNKDLELFFTKNN